MLSVGVDVGTTRTKAIAIDSGGHTRAVEADVTPWSSARRRRLLRPESLLSTVESLIARLLDRVPRERVEAVGFTSIAESGFLCRPGGVALLPAIPWSDSGGTDAAAAWESEFGRDAFSQVTGLRLSSTPSLFKLRELGGRSGWDHPVRWLSVAEWLAVQFGAEPHAERSLASRTGLVDITRGCVDDDLRAWTRLPLVDTALVWAGDPVGTVRPTAPMAGATIVIGGHDHLCAAVGAEATLTGDVLNSFGTAEAYIATAETTTSPKQVLERRRAGLETGYHVVRGAHSLIIGDAHGSHLSHVVDDLRQPIPAIEERHGGTDPSVGSPPEVRNDPDAQRWLREVQVTHSESLRMARTIAAHTSMERVIGTGGWLQSRWISDLKRRDLPHFVVSPHAETAARGAAVLAGRAVGVNLATG